MAKSYENGTLLTGILFLQLVSQVQLQGSEKKRTRLFKTIMGENAYQRVVIATTMWNQLSEAEATVRQNQRKIRADVWGDMVSRGTRVVRHGDNVESATGIVQLLAQFKTPVTLQIQKELLVSGGRVARTSEGRQLDEDLGTEVAKLREEIEALRIAREDISNENRDLRDKIARLEQDRDKLQRSNVSDPPSLPSLPFPSPSLLVSMPFLRHFKASKSMSEHFLWRGVQSQTLAGILAQVVPLVLSVAVAPACIML